MTIIGEEVGKTIQLIEFQENNGFTELFLLKISTKL